MGEGGRDEEVASSKKKRIDFGFLSPALKT